MMRLMLLLHQLELAKNYIDMGMMQTAIDLLERGLGVSGSSERC